MGGNALKNCATRRYAAEEYYALENEVVYKLATMFQMSTGNFETPGIAPIKSYRLKESFGDMDILLCSGQLPTLWQAYVIEEFKPKQWVKNGNCFSFEYKEFQIDLIITPEEEFETSYNYFAYNDLGNLLGRVAHALGLKLGHDGLSYNWRVETYQFRNVILLRNWEDILPVLGYRWKDYVNGFDTPEDIFKFVEDSPFFTPDIYLLQNRNHTSRVRDAKRKTYTDFLKWLENSKSTYSSGPLEGDKAGWLPYLFAAIPNFQDTYNQVQEEWELERKIKQCYNGDVVREATGLEDKQLGKFMQWMKQHHNHEIRTLVPSLNPTIVPRWIQTQYLKYKEIK